MVEQAEILEHHADAPPQRRERIRRQSRDIVAEQIDQPARRLEREKQHPQERGFARAGRPGEKLERVRLKPEADIAQHFRADAVAQTDVFEADHASSESALDGHRARAGPLVTPAALRMH